MAANMIREMQALLLDDFDANNILFTRNDTGILDFHIIGFKEMI